MKGYFSNVPKSSVGSHSIEQLVQTPNANTLSENVELTSNLDEIEINQNDIVSDPGLRKPIESFNVNIRDRIRREYASKGPCQPHNHIFLKKKYGGGGWGAAVPPDRWMQGIKFFNFFN